MLWQDTSQVFAVLDAAEFSLDPDTAHKHLCVSEDKHTVSYEEDEQHHENNQDRFIKWEQVMSSTALTERCYCEVTWSGNNEIIIAVSYRGISRVEDQSKFGDNEQSWSLRINNEECTASHNQQNEVVAGRVGEASSRDGVASGRVGVSLDSRAGVLSFFRIDSDSRHKLHTFTHRFSEDLFLGFRLSSPGSFVSIVSPRNLNGYQELDI